jgi:ankyrin repeat protein
LVELDADINQATKSGGTPLVIAAGQLHHDIVRYLLKRGAKPQASHDEFGTAADVSRYKNAPAAETAYLQARTHCANPNCTNAGLKKCERCLQSYFCGNACIRAHWPAHKAECKAAAAKLKAVANASSSSSSSSSS